MTIEELEIIVTAKVEEALRDFKKIEPQVKQVMQKVQNEIGKVDFKAIKEQFRRAINNMSKKMSDLKNSMKQKFDIKINNKQAKEQITQLEKEIDALEKKINAKQMKLNVTNGTLDTLRENTRNDVIKEMPDAGNKKIKNETYTRLENNGAFLSMSEESDKLARSIENDNEKLSAFKMQLAGLKGGSKLSLIFLGAGEAIKKVASGVKDVTQKIANGMGNAIKKVSGLFSRLKKNSDGIGSTFKTGLKNVLKYAGALFGIRTIYNVLRNSAQAWLSSQNALAQQLSANIEYMKYAMGSVLAPVIEYVINLVYKLMKAIQSVAYAFSGVNIFAKATASSMKSASGSAKQASKSLSGVHSEINNVSENNNGGSGGEMSPSIDLSTMDNSMNNWISELKAKLEILFEPIQNSWNKYGQPLIDSMINAFTGVKKLITSIGQSFQEVWTNGTGEHTVSTILQILTSVFNTIGNIGEAFSNAWENNANGTEIIQNIWDGFNNILDIILMVQQAYEEWTASESFQTFANSIIEICATLSLWFKKITDKLKEIWENGGKETFTKLLEFISKLIETIDVVLKTLTPVIDFILDIVTPIIEGIIKIIGDVIDVLSGVLDFIIGVFTGDWERAWTGIKEIFSGIWNIIKDVVKTVWDTITNIISTVIDKIKTVISNVFNAIKNTITAIWDGIKTTISNVVTTIKDKISTAFDNIKTKITTIMDNIKTTISNIWNGIWGTIKNIINSILGGIEGMANGIVRGINKVISIMNKLKFNIPDWVPGLGGKTFGFNLSEMGEISIPRLAKGGVLYDEQLVRVAEYSGASSNPEIISPQNIMYDTMLRALSDAATENNNDRPIGITVNVGNERLGRILLNDLRDIKRQTGQDLEVIVGG